MSRRSISIAAAGAAGLLIGGYALFEAWRLIEGPRLTIYEPAAGSATSSPGVVVRGKAENISFLTVNDRPAYTDEYGNFTEVLSPPPGYTVVTVAATDRFGRRAAESIPLSVLNYCPVS